MDSWSSTVAEYILGVLVKSRKKITKISVAKSLAVSREGQEERNTSEVLNGMVVDDNNREKKK